MNLEYELWFVTWVLKGHKEEPLSWSQNTTSICHWKLKSSTQFANVGQKHCPVAQASYLKDMLRNWIWPLCADRSTGLWNLKKNGIHWRWIENVWKTLWADTSISWKCLHTSMTAKQNPHADCYCERQTHCSKDTVFCRPDAPLTVATSLYVVK